MFYKYRYSDRLTLKLILVLLFIAFFCSLIFLIFFDIYQTYFWNEITICLINDINQSQCLIDTINGKYSLLSDIYLIISGINNILSIMLTFIMFVIYKHKGIDE